MHLSKHFTIQEACRSMTADRYDIDNTAPAEIAKNLVLVAENILEPIREHYGIPFTPNSWFRCLELNYKINSKPTSQHITGQAVDIEVPTISNKDLAHWINKNLDFDQLLLEFYKFDDPFAGWVHVSYVSPEENRKQVLTLGKRTITGLPDE
jgi:zinc D-Ala-D-Ala carboxypeptidase